MRPIILGMLGIPNHCLTKIPAILVVNSSLIQLFQILKAISARLVLSLLLALGLTACSAVRLGYNNAPELGYWWLDSYIGFDEAQSIQVRADLAALQVWHRKSELPVFISTLEKLERLVPTKLTATQLCALYDEQKPRLQAVLDQAEPAVVALAAKLSSEQLDHLTHQLDQRSEKWREKWLDVSPAERQQRRIKQFRNRAEMLYGPLEEAQRSLLRASVAASVFKAELSYRESLRRHRDTLQTLRHLQNTNLTVPQARAAVHAWLARSIGSPNARYREQLERIVQENCNVLAALHNSSTAAQRSKAIETLKDYQADARALLTDGQ